MEFKQINFIKKYHIKIKLFFVALQIQQVRTTKYSLILSISL